MPTEDTNNTDALTSPLADTPCSTSFSDMMKIWEDEGNVINSGIDEGDIAKTAFVNGWNNAIYEILGEIATNPNWDRDAGDLLDNDLLNS